jgi:hypothetical protein
MSSHTPAIDADDAGPGGSSAQPPLTLGNSHASSRGDSVITSIAQIPLLMSQTPNEILIHFMGTYGYDSQVKSVTSQTLSNALYEYRMMDALNNPRHPDVYGCGAYAPSKNFHKLWCISVGDVNLQKNLCELLLLARSTSSKECSRACASVGIGGGGGGAVANPRNDACSVCRFGVVLGSVRNILKEIVKRVHSMFDVTWTEERIQAMCPAMPDISTCQHDELLQWGCTMLTWVRTMYAEISPYSLKFPGMSEEMQPQMVLSAFRDRAKILGFQMQLKAAQDIRMLKALVPRSVRDHETVETIVQSVIRSACSLAAAHANLKLWYYKYAICKYGRQYVMDVLSSGNAWGVRTTADVERVFSLMNMPLMGVLMACPGDSCCDRKKQGVDLLSTGSHAQTRERALHLFESYGDVLFTHGLFSLMMRNNTHEGNFLSQRIFQLDV